MRIVGGEPATVGSWPWAAIVGRSSRNGRIIVHCGGTLINEGYIEFPLRKLGEGVTDAQNF